MKAQAMCMLGIAAYWFATPPLRENDHGDENVASVSRNNGVWAAPCKSRGGVSG